MNITSLLFVQTKGDACDYILNFFVIISETKGKKKVETTGNCV
jgi:hypothetical protein